MNSSVNILNNCKDPLVSLATPVYNCGSYIAECIESVLSQTYKNWEYTIIDNLSTDDTYSIASRYANLDNRIRVYKNEKHVGIIENHNIAFRSFSENSKYCKLVLADDWLFPDCLMEMVELAEKYPSIGLICSYALDGKNVIWDGLSYPGTFKTGRDICRLNLLENIYVFGNPSSQFYRSDIVRRYSDFYSEWNLHADYEACFDILRYSDFGFVHKILTFMRLREESASNATKKMNGYILGKINIIKKYGHFYLNDEEYKVTLNRIFEYYYKLLAKEILRLRGGYIKEYHNNYLKNIGIKINRYKLTKAIFYELLDRLGNPKDSFHGIIKWWPQAIGPRGKKY